MRQKLLPVLLPGGYPGFIRRRLHHFPYYITHMSTLTPNLPGPPVPMAGENANIAPLPPAVGAGPAVERWPGKLKDVVLVLGSVPRWRMLKVLAGTEWLPVSFLAVKGEVARSAASKHVAVLLKTKVIERGVGRLYRLVPALRPPPGADYMDFGWCRMKLTPPQ